MIRIVSSTNRAEVEALLSPARRSRSGDRAGGGANRRPGAGRGRCGGPALCTLARWLERPDRGLASTDRRRGTPGAGGGAGGAEAGRAGDSRGGRGAAAARVAGVAHAWRTVSQRVLPLDRVGCYVPGGRYPLPSSLLMTAIPARVAGVPEVVVCSPSVDPVVLAAVVEAGVDRVFRLGGAHAVAAMAYGTATRAAGQQDRRTGQPLGVGGQGAGRGGLPDRLLRRADRDPDRGRTGPGVVDCRRPHRAGRARPRRAGGVHHVESRAGDAGRGGSRAVSCRPPDRRPRRCGVTAASSSRDRWPRPRRWPTPPPPSTWWWTPKPGPGRFVMPARSSSERGRRRSPATMPSDRITRCPPPALPGYAAACTPPTS